MKGLWVYWCLRFYFINQIAVFKVNALISITKIITRLPREHDIALIFGKIMNITIDNEATHKKELLEYSIRSDGPCQLNVSTSEMADNMGYILGGNFGFIEAGTTEVVSIMWPTVSLYNRIGYCPIIIISSNANDEIFKLKQIIKFDTRFEMLDPEGHNFQKQKNFMDCNNWDQDYFRNCTPVDCEERYFGRRSYYNVKTQHCEEVPKCSEKDQYYDFFANECINSLNFCDAKDINEIKKGKYDNNLLELKPVCGQYDNTTKMFDNKNIFSNFFGHDFYKRAAVRPSVNGNNYDFSASTYNENENNSSVWMQGITDGLIIVFVTVTIYILICFIIFLIVTWFSRRPCRDQDGIIRPVLSTPALSENSVNILTSSSLMSQR